MAAADEIVRHADRLLALAAFAASRPPHALAAAADGSPGSDALESHLEAVRGAYDAAARHRQLALTSLAPLARIGNRALKLVSENPPFVEDLGRAGASRSRNSPDACR